MHRARTARVDLPAVGKEMPELCVTRDMIVEVLRNKKKKAAI